MSFDVTDPADLLTLKTEVNTDPLSLGYAAVVDSTTALLNLLNGKEHSPTFIVSKPKISSAEVRGATTLEAYDNLVADEQEWLRWMTGSNGFEEDNILVTTDLRLRLAGPDDASIWSVVNRVEMNQAMLDLIDVAGSRMEILFGYDTVISRNDWITARES